VFLLSNKDYLIKVDSAGLELKGKHWWPMVKAVDKKKP